MIEHLEIQLDTLQLKEVAAPAKVTVTYYRDRWIALMRVSIVSEKVISLKTVIFTGIIIFLERKMTQYLQLMKTLPPLVSVVVWDVMNDRIDELTIKLAQATSKEEFERYDLIRCVVAADPKHPPIDLAKSLVDEMVENMAPVQ